MWLAKERDWATKRYLLKMIEWREQIARGSAYDRESSGKRLGMNRDTWEALGHLFGRFDHVESWCALSSSMALFRRLATEVAAACGLAYPSDVDMHISGFIARVREASSGKEG